jgi:putative addiction module component (TIGR02574 family)
MTKLMQTLFEEASKLPEDEQDVLAANWLLDVRDDEPSQELRDELDRRLRDHEANPESGITWDALKERILKRLTS